MDKIDQDLALIQQWKTNSSSIDIWAANKILGQIMIMTPQEVGPDLITKMESLCRNRKDNLLAQQELEDTERAQLNEYKELLINACQDLAIFEQELKRDVRQFKALQRQERLAYLTMLHSGLNTSDHESECEAEKAGTGQESQLAPGELFSASHWAHLQTRVEQGEVDGVFQALSDDATFVSRTPLIRKYESNQERNYQTFRDANDAKRQVFFHNVQQAITDAALMWTQACRDKQRKMQELKEQQEKLKNPFPPRVFEIPSVFLHDPSQAYKMYPHKPTHKDE
jgi:hypothetical protein